MTIPAEQWATIAREAELLGLRPTAKARGVSHQTIANIVRRVAEMTDLAAD